MYLQGSPPPDITSVNISFSTATDCVHPTYKSLSRSFSSAGVSVVFLHKQHVRCVVLPQVMWIPSDCEPCYKHGGPVRCSNDTFRLRSFVRPNLRRVLEDGIRKISSVNDFKTRTPFSCLVTLCFHHFHVFILCFDV